MHRDRDLPLGQFEAECEAAVMRISISKSELMDHTLDLVLTYGIEIDHLNVSAQNLVLSDHYLVTFEFLVIN